MRKHLRGDLVRLLCVSGGWRKKAHSGFLSLISLVAFLPVFGIVLPLMVVRMRVNRSATGRRRSHHALKAPALWACNNCGALCRPHHMCQECGMYRGRQIMDMAAKRAAREARLRATKERMKAEAAQHEEDATSPSAPATTDTQTEATSATPAEAGNGEVKGEGEETGEKKA